MMNLTERDRLPARLNIDDVSDYDAMGYDAAPRKVNRRRLLRYAAAVQARRREEARRLFSDMWNKEAINDTQ